MWFNVNRILSAKVLPEQHPDESMFGANKTFGLV
jgi:hypothetical protein